MLFRTVLNPVGQACRWVDCDRENAVEFKAFSVLGTITTKVSEDAFPLLQFQKGRFTMKTVSKTNSVGALVGAALAATGLTQQLASQAHAANIVPKAPGSTVTYILSINDDGTDH